MGDIAGGGGTDSGIYVDVFSNASLDLYPTNTVSSFKTKLATPLHFDDGGNYFCALAEMVCPNSAEPRKLSGKLLIRTKPDNPILRLDGTLASMTEPFNQDESGKHMVAVPQSHYFGQQYTPPPAPSSMINGTVADYAFCYTIPDEVTFPNGIAFVKYLNSLLTTDKTKHSNASFADILTRRIIPSAKTEKEKFSIHLDLSISSTDQSSELSVFIRDSDISLAISSDLAQILGFNVANDQWLIFYGGAQYTYFNNTIDINAIRPSILAVYSSVILPHFVGDTQAPLLRVCTLPKNRSGPIGFHSFSFNQLHYLPVSVKYVQELEIEIRGNDGSLIPFQAGILYIRLHFIRRS